MEVDTQNLLGGDFFVVAIDKDFLTESLSLPLPWAAYSHCNSASFQMGLHSWAFINLLCLPLITCWGVCWGRTCDEPHPIFYRFPWKPLLKFCAVRSHPIHFWLPMVIICLSLVLVSVDFRVGYCSPSCIHHVCLEVQTGFQAEGRDADTLLGAGAWGREEAEVGMNDWEGMVKGRGRLEMKGIAGDKLW